KDMGLIRLPCSNHISSNTTKGWAEISSAAKPLSTYFKAQTIIPFPKERKRTPTINVFKNCFRVIARLLPNTFAMIKIKSPPVVNRMEAKKKGGSSATATLLSIYVDPQRTKMEKKASTITIVAL